jgi:hypothetical protein
VFCPRWLEGWGHFGQVRWSRDQRWRNALRFSALRLLRLLAGVGPARGAGRGHGWRNALRFSALRLLAPRRTQPLPRHVIAIFAPGDRPTWLEYGAGDLTP